MKLTSILIACTLLLFTSPAMAQTKTFYYDSKHNETVKEAAEYYRVFTLQNNKTYSFETRNATDNRLLAKGTYATLDSQSRTGEFASYHENGKIEEQGQYLNNKKTGLWKTYTDSGMLKEEGTYVDGQQQGLWKYYYENSKQLWYNVDMVADKRDGTLKSFHKNGKLKRIEQLDKGRTISGECYDKDGKEIEFTPFLQMPYTSYSIPQFLADNVHYPQKAMDDMVQGRVFASFVIDRQGNVTKLKISKSLSKECDAEVMRVMRLMPKWVPGVMDDEQVDVWYAQPVRFKLQD